MKKNVSRLFLFYLSVIILIAANTISYAAGNSPFPAPEETDTSFVTDSGVKLDQYLFRDSSPITFDIEIERYVGELNGDGTLADIQSLIDNKIVSETATLRMPVYDVDDDYTGGYYVREIDTVYFNGHFVGYLSGGNGNWKQNSFTCNFSISAGKY